MQVILISAVRVSFPDSDNRMDSLDLDVILLTA